MNAYHSKKCPLTVATLFDCMSCGAFNLHGIRALLNRCPAIPLDEQFCVPSTIMTHPRVRSATVLCTAVLCGDKYVLEMVINYVKNRYPDPSDFIRAIDHWGLVDANQPGTPRLNAMSAAVTHMEAIGEKNDTSLDGLDNGIGAWADYADRVVMVLFEHGASLQSAVWTGCTIRSECVRMDGTPLSDDDQVSGCVPLIDTIVLYRRYRLAATLVSYGVEMTPAALMNVDSLDFITFLHRRGVAVDALNARDPDGGIVHVMAREPNGTREEDAEILRYIKTAWPEMLHQLDRAGRNSRQVAHECGNQAFIAVFDEMAM